uniref:Putative ovule protein n=1 Tax=Solanum chacoense TaxID=4108 RepID=A0A0V0GK80_SOLCH
MLQRLLSQSKYVEWHLSRETTPWDFQLSCTLRSLHTGHLHLPSLPRCLLDFCLCLCLCLCPFLEHDS